MYNKIERVIIMTCKELFLKVDDILQSSDKPSVEIRELIDEGSFDQKPFIKIKNLEDIEQDLIHHPEGNVLNHTLLVIDKASDLKEKSKNKRVFMWAALLHDLGKLTTTKKRKNRITAYGHDLQGEILSRQFLHQVTEDEKFIDEVCILVKHHMQPLFYDKKLPYFKEKEIINDSDYEEISLLSLADRLGRSALYEDKIKQEEKRINNFKNFFADKYK
ncbi:HD domain-containing protein [Terrisporobacter petrolearius]|uniref:HD domain-containing protein n=1 Tax=Terrisporobacter petrolearius TaxID=1460447 RepID=UPI001D161C4F|nr:HD domain-containing protein [Terrisporobacter petrolearius]MCC3864931.1 HD domain-containing protein [Terrisporobacter petrolearius]